MIQLTDARKFQLKLAATLCLLAVILYSANWGNVWSVLNQVSVILLLPIVGLFILIVLVSAWKWWWLLRIHLIPYPFSDLCRWYFIAFFFNNFLPSSIGGDGFRIYRTLSNNRTRSTAVVAVFIERISGLLILLGLGFLAAIFSHYLSGNAFSTTTVYVGVTVLVLMGVATMVTLNTSVVSGLISRVKRSRAIPEKVTHVLSHLRDYRANRTGSVAVVGISILFHGINILGLWMLTKVVGADISLVDLTVVVTSVNIISILPISINGIGLVDGAFVYMLSLYGVDSAQGLSFSIILRFLVLPISVLGMIFYIADKRVTNTKPAL